VRENNACATSDPGTLEGCPPKFIKFPTELVKFSISSLASSVYTPLVVI